jgi:serine/threonine protein kinase
LGDRYGAFNAIGGGVSSRTYLAIDTRKLFEPRCIIKGFVHADGTASQMMESFRREVARLDELSRHPQLPRLYAYFERGNQQYLVQEFVNGRSLLQQMEQDGTFDESQIRRLLHDLLPVLQFLHSHQIIHRDIKPTNLIRHSGDQQLMLVDFGATKLLTQPGIASTGTLVGSAEYAAPEQLVGRAIVASDLYSLGVTCIHLLTGIRPFDLFDTASGTWFWRSVAGLVSDRLANVLDQMLKPNVSQRYRSTAEVMQDLGISEAAQPLSKPKLGSTHPAEITPQNWRCAQRLDAKTEVNTIALTRTGQIVISGGNDGVIRVWSCARGEILTSLATQGQAITSLAIAPDEQTIVSGGWDQVLRLWNWRIGKLVHTLIGHTSVVTSVAISPNGRFLLSGSRDQTIRLWEMATGQLLHCFGGHQAAVEAIALGADNETVVSSDTSGIVKIWHLKTRELLRSLSGHTASVPALALSPDDYTLISGSWDMTIKLRNIHVGGTFHTLSGHLLPITSASISPDGQFIATGSHDSTIKLWQLASGQLLATLWGHTAAVESVTFSADGGFIASGSRDGTIRIWQREEGREKAEEGSRSRGE